MAITAGAIAAVVSAAEHEPGAPLLQKLRSLTGDSCFKDTCKDVYESCLDTTAKLYCTDSGTSNDCRLNWDTWCKSLEKKCDDYDSSDCVTERQLTGNAVEHDCCKDYCIYIHKTCVDLTTDGNYDHCFEFHCECIKDCNECWDPLSPCNPYNCPVCRPCGPLSHACEPCPLCPDSPNEN